MPHDTSKHSPDLLREVLGKLVIKPRLSASARSVGIHPSSIFNWIGKSRAGDPDFVISWMGVERPFHEHVDIARKLSVVAMDHSARDQAINGWSERRFHDGKPVWKHDPKLVAEALDPLIWSINYPGRPLTDTYARGIDNELI